MKQLKINSLIIRSLGIQEYQATWQKMREWTEQRTPETTDECWLLQHAPVFTLGQAGDPKHILNPGNIPIVQSDRGGQVTYHGPGQLIAYCLFDLNRHGLHSRSFVRAIEQTLIQLLDEYGLNAYADENAPGIYIEGKKIASLGLRIKRGYAYHGLALNVKMDSEPFQRINPCGFPELKMCQLNDWLPGITVTEVGKKLTHQLQHVFGYGDIYCE